MGFIAHTSDMGHIQPFEMQPVTGSIAVDIGTGLVMTSGKLALATGTAKPSYTSAVKIAATTDGDYIAVQRVSEAIVYETELSVASADIAPGAKYTLDATGGKITATTASGVAEVVSFDGKAAGDKVRVRF